MKPWEKYQSGAPWQKYQKPDTSSGGGEIVTDDAGIQYRVKDGKWEEIGPAPQPKTLDDAAEEVFGFDPKADRLPILPRILNKKDEFDPVAPQWLVDLAKGFLLPGHVMKGGSYTPTDTTKFALDYLLPVERGGRAVRAVKPSRKAVRKFVRKAPTSEDLQDKAGPLFDQVRESGIRIGDDDLVDLLARLEARAVDADADVILTPKVSRVVSNLSKRMGQPQDIGDLMVIRRQLGRVSRLTGPDTGDERRIANILIDTLDDYVDTLSVGPKWVEARRLWNRSIKSDLIEDAIKQGQMAASGEENGIRNALRAMLKKEKNRKKFSEAEISVLERVIQGTVGTNTLKRLSRMSFGGRGQSNYLGGMIGIGLGDFLFGPVGAMTAPVAGRLAAGAARRGTLGGANLARAMAATGKIPPPGYRGRLTDLLSRSVGVPLAAQTAADAEALEEAKARLLQRFQPPAQRR